jgi:ATP-binding cassette subfamily C (CFTR/MRP) protein 1
MTVHRLSAADHIIALGKDGRLVEHGSFRQLHMGTGYIGSLNLRRRKIPTKPPPVEREQLVRRATNAAMRVSKVFTVVEEEQSEKKTSSGSGEGDLTVYGYYIETFGWLHWGLFFVLCGFYGFGTAFPRKSGLMASEEKWFADFWLQRCGSTGGLRKTTEIRMEGRPTMP